MTSLSCVPKWSTKIKSALSSYLAFAVHPTAICLIVLNVLLFKKELPLRLTVTPSLSESSDFPLTPGNKRQCETSSVSNYEKGTERVGGWPRSWLRQRWNHCLFEKQTIRMKGCVIHLRRTNSIFICNQKEIGANGVCSCANIWTIGLNIVTILECKILNNLNRARAFLTLSSFRCRFTADWK